LAEEILSETEEKFELIKKIADLKKEGLFWLMGQVGLVLIAGFFIYFGVLVLMGAFELNEPFSFILTFFASNFIILISAALLIGFLYRISAFCKGLHTGKPQETEDNE